MSNSHLRPSLLIKISENLGGFNGAVQRPASYLPVAVLLSPLGLIHPANPFRRQPRWKSPTLVVDSFTCVAYDREKDS
jgi:hypothetical protein